MGVDREESRRGQGGRGIEALTGAFKKHKTNDRAPEALSGGNKFAYLMYVPLRASLFICFISGTAALPVYPLVLFQSQLCLYA